MMDLKEFVRQLFLMYTNSYNEANKTYKKRQYLSALDNPKVDYEILMDRIAKYHNDDFMPPSAWLKEESKYCYKEEIKNASLDYIHTKVYDPRYNSITSTDCFPRGTTVEQMIKTYEKMFNCKGWKILEVY